MGLSRRDILGKVRPRLHPYTFGDMGDVWLRELTAGDVDRLGDDMEPVMLLVLSVTDADGVPLFTEADVDALKSLSLRTVNPAALKIQEINGLADAGN